MTTPNSNNIGQGTGVKLSYSSIEVYSKTHGTVEIKFDTIEKGLVDSYTWSVTKIGKKLYAVTTIYCEKDKKHKTQYMHRVLTKFKYDLVDHINGDSLDNRSENLRNATKSLNSRNQPQWRLDLPTGVYKRGNRYFSRFVYMGETVTVGTFDTIEEAIEKRKELMRERKIEL
jgi:hypothetical protein